MPDNLNISTPISGNTNITRPNQMPKEPMQVNVIDPTKVGQPNTDKQSQQNANMDLLFSRDSVFSTFVNQLRQAPALSQTLQKMVFDMIARRDSIHKNESVPAILKQLAETSEMDKAEMLKNLQYQRQNATKFSGAFFEMLRGISKQNPGREFDVRMARFLKSYEAVFSASDTMNAIIRQLKQLCVQLPKYYGRKLHAPMEELLTDDSLESIQQNLTVLKEKILPLLSEYASRTKDIGTARDTISLLIHTLARLNIGSREDLLNKFSDLMEYCRRSLNLADESYGRMQELFANQLTGSQKLEKNVWLDSLINLLSDGKEQSVSGLGQTFCKDVWSSLLLDNSVFMPFVHLYLPVNYQGRAMFTELWIEKDAENKESALTETPGHVYLTFEIQDLGYFEMTVELYRTRMAVQLSCPPSLMNREQEIQEAVSQIFSQNGLTTAKITLSAQNSPKVRGYIFQKIVEWREQVDVSV